MSGLSYYTVKSSQPVSKYMDIMLKEFFMIISDSLSCREQSLTSSTSGSTSSTSRSGLVQTYQYLQYFQPTFNKFLDVPVLIHCCILRFEVQSKAICFQYLVCVVCFQYHNTSSSLLLKPASSASNPTCINVHLQYNFNNLLSWWVFPAWVQIPFLLRFQEIWE